MNPSKSVQSDQVEALGKSADDCRNFYPKKDACNAPKTTCKWTDGKCVPRPTTDCKSISNKNVCVISRSTTNHNKACCWIGLRKSGGVCSQLCSCQDLKSKTCEAYFKSKKCKWDGATCQPDSGGSSASPSPPSPPSSPPRECERTQSRITCCSKGGCKCVHLLPACVPHQPPIQNASRLAMRTLDILDMVTTSL